MVPKSRLYLAFAAVVAVMVCVPATSSAGQFNFGSTSNYQSKATSNQVFTLNEGRTLKCVNASGSGGVESLSYINLTVVYSSCNLVGATVSQTSGTRFAYYPDGHMDVLQPLVAAANTILGKITLTIKAQNGLKVVNYSNQGNNLLIDHEVGGIAYSLEGTGAFAGLTHSDTNGTLDGNDEVQMNDGARINWEP